MNMRFPGVLVQPIIQVLSEGYKDDELLISLAIPPPTYNFDQMSGSEGSNNFRTSQNPKEDALR